MYLLLKYLLSILVRKRIVTQIWVAVRLLNFNSLIHRNTKHPQKGFSLLSLIITISIVSILSTIASPSLSAIHNKYESISLSSTVFRHLRLTRSLAVYSNQVMTLCGVLNDQTNCQKQNFNQLIIFEDSNRDGTLDLNEKLHRHTALNYSGQVIFQASFGRNYIRFKPRGSAEVSASFIYCNTSYPQSSARVTLSHSGRAYVARKRNNNGIIKEADGSAISC